MAEATKKVCVIGCFFKSRYWDPDSRLEKDKVYMGTDETPKKFNPRTGKRDECFKTVGINEKVDVIDDAAEQKAISQLQSKNEHMNGPVVDGKAVDTDDAPDPMS